MTSMLVLPGIYNSGPQHWQSLWELADPAFQRVRQRDWSRPECAEWVATLEQAVAAAGADSVLVAHSMGCLLAVHWAQQTKLTVRAALLVAPPDPWGAAFPGEASGFAPVPMQVLPFRSMVVASTDDPYGGAVYAAPCAKAWGSELQVLEGAGHINADSGLGDWPQGMTWLRGLCD